MTDPARSSVLLTYGLRSMSWPCYPRLYNMGKSKVDEIEGSRGGGKWGRKSSRGIKTLAFFRVMEKTAVCRIASVFVSDC